MELENVLVRDVAIIMATAGIALLVFRRLGQPPILGYLIAGVIVGPFTLPIPSIEDIETIRLLSDLGLVVLLFALGLEFGWERIRQVGMNVVIIGVMEIAFMMALGYEIGVLMGWTGAEAIFLGACIAISSSAVLVKVLRDAGKLREGFARLIVGILVVEDFAAVILLTLLSGVADIGPAVWSDVGFLAGKLVLFAVAALTLGTLLAPRLIGWVARLRSTEALLLVSLALCFGLALLGQELGLSAAAGAFLIGTVLGDTKQSHDIYEIMVPIRDMFGALFFVSIGMLIDVRQIPNVLLPALLVSFVFVAGKVLANTLGTFLTGHDFRTSLRVGMGMPQIGEFSLAMAKVGTERAALGAFFYPILAVTTAFTSAAYPYIFRSADAAARYLERRSPRMLQLYVVNLERWLAFLRRSSGKRSPVTQRLNHATRVALLNIAIIMTLVAVGTFALRFSNELSSLLPLPEGLVGLVIGFGVIALCVPSGFAIWRELQAITEELTVQLFQRRAASLRRWNREDLRQVIRDSILAALVVLIAIWTIPFVSHLLSLGRLSIPVPLLLLGGAVFITARIAFKIHAILVATFSRTFLGQQKDPDPDPPDEPKQGDS
ncbi:MAG: cation:proton antiporter [Chloroflexi bacterium]|nr:cation:proton antiporter [Chloroflexota bacterium]